jgi:hypothetical protein
MEGKFGLQEMREHAGYKDAETQTNRVQKSSSSHTDWLKECKSAETSD